MKDIQGWMVFFYCISVGYQYMVRFFLDSGVNVNVRELIYGFIFLMEVVVVGYEIIVQYFLNYGVKVDVRDYSGVIVWMLVKQYGYMKIVVLMDIYLFFLFKSFYWSLEKYEDLSFFDEFCFVFQRQRLCWKKGVSIYEGL